MYVHNIALGSFDALYVGAWISLVRAGTITILFFFFLMIRHPPRSPLSPYTPLFRSKIIRVVPAIELRMLFRDGIVARLQALPSFGFGRGDVLPRPPAAAPAMIRAAVGHGFFN